ncbi:helix-turn-helix domain-containing protein [Cryptosporangium sp. NPDC051539]|uniref:helix-turn-helix domain-containing protein n=1 Tax=Cryptosporangium sp. NPDC051539 TaxID=3363962 RepID=UPI003794DFCB
MTKASDVLSPALRRLEVAAALKRHREASELTTSQVLAATGFSASKLSRIETGNRPVQVDDLTRLCELYDLDAAERARLGKLADEARRRTTRKTIVDNRDFAELERAASAIEDYKSSVVTGLLQTPDYTRSLFRRLQPDIPGDLLEKVVAARLDRQERIFGRSNPPRLHFILDEAVLRRTVGGASLMRAQLKHLAELTFDENFIVQVIPFSAGAHPAVDSLFTILSFDEAIRDRVYIDGLAPPVFLVDMSSLRTYRAVFSQIRELSLDQASSRELIASAARDL